MTARCVNCEHPLVPLAEGTLGDLVVVVEWSCLGCGAVTDHPDPSDD